MSQYLLAGIVLGILIVLILAGISSIDVRSASDQIRRALLDFEREGESFLERIKRMLDEQGKKK
jgi:hypothetical protein